MAATVTDRADCTCRRRLRALLTPGGRKVRRSSSLAGGLGSGARSHDSVYEGFTDEGDRFLVPETLDTVATLLPWNWSITSVLTLSLLLLNAYCIAFARWSKWPHVFYFLFFRVCYDVGLGVLLRAQSERKAFTRWYERTLRAVGGVGSRHWLARLFHHLAATQIQRSPTSSSSPAVDVDSYPTAFRAWLVYKNLVNVILINDGLNYLLLGVKCFHWPTELSWLVALQYALGLFLALFNCTNPRTRARSAAGMTAQCCCVRLH